MTDPPLSHTKTMCLDAAPDAVYTLKQVSAHSTPSDLWVVIYNKVYDITEFVKDHPGGGEVLFDCGGADATEAFEDVGHSQDALDMLGPYLKGSLPPKELRPYSKGKAKSSPAFTRTQSTKHRELAVMWISLILLAVFVVVALQKAHWINLTKH